MKTRRTVCTYAVGATEYRAMALSMLISVYENASASVDRYVIFTDSLDWAQIPEWVELIQMDCAVSADWPTNWSIKPIMLNHPALEEDLVLYLDADTTVYRDIIGRCFDWIEQHSMLVYMDLLEPDEMWGPINLTKIFVEADVDARNFKINSGVIGRAPNELGRRMTQFYEELFVEGKLRPFFADSLYRKNDEPYLGLAAQFSHTSLGVPVPERFHELTVDEYAVTTAAIPRLFRATPGPVIRVSWYPEDIVCPAIVHWVSATQYLYFRRLLWSSLRRGGLLHAWIGCLLKAEFLNTWERIRLKCRALLKRWRRS